MSEPSIAALEARLEAVGSEPKLRVDALNDLAWALRTSDPTRANALAAEARTLAMNEGYVHGRARAARTLAMCVVDEAGMDQIFALAEEAKNLFDEAGDDLGRAGSRDFLASIHEHIGDYGAGLDFALDALDIARSLGDPVRQGYALSSVGGILAASGQIDAGVERLEEALALFRQVDNTDGVGTICSRLCRVLRSAGRNDEALRYAELCHEAGKGTDNEYFLEAAYTVRAEIEAEAGRFEEAERLYRAAIGCYALDQARKVIGTGIQVELARVIMKMGDPDRAELELLDALERVRGDPVSIVTESESRAALADLYEARGEPSKALEQLRELDKLRELRARRDARAKLAQVEIRARMEMARKDAEIHKLRFVELHAMQTKLVEAEKMAVLGKLAAGTAHELNTPLGVIRSNTKLLQRAAERLEELMPEAARDKADKLVSILRSSGRTTEEAVDRLAKIADSFRRFAKLDQAERQRFDVREGLQSAIALLEPTIPSGVEVRAEWSEVPSIEGWPRELNHAFMTVLQNAVQAVNGPGVVTVSTSIEDDQLLVRITDSGRGMSEEQVKNLFDVSWSSEKGRTKMRFGLSAAYATVEKHGGSLEVSSRPGRGTTVSFRLPGAPEANDLAAE